MNTLSPALFSQFNLPDLLVKNLTVNGLLTPKPIQEKAIPPMLIGHDILGIAQTGSGKTLAFSLPLLAKMISAGVEKRKPKTVLALVLAPTRELVVQIEETMRFITRNTHLSITAVFGGVSRLTQIKSISRGIDILIATPGRLIDHIREKNIDLSRTCFLILDEADRMLDMGFIHDVRQISALLASNRQTALFSATMPKKILHLAKSLLKNPIYIETTPPGTAVTKITQSLYRVSAHDKKKVLARLLRMPGFRSVIVFTRTKYGADSVNRYLEKSGYRTAAIHGNKSQNARQRALKGFRSGNLQILVATDIASRGIDIPGISHVVNYELPDAAGSYVHRIGRTGRNGSSGYAITLYDEALERMRLRAVERVIREKIVLYNLPELPEAVRFEENIDMSAKKRNKLDSLQQAQLKNIPFFCKRKDKTDNKATSLIEKKRRKKQRRNPQYFGKVKRENFRQHKSFAKVA